MGSLLSEVASIETNEEFVPMYYTTHKASIFLKQFWSFWGGGIGAVVSTSIR